MENNVARMGIDNGNSAEVLKSRPIFDSALNVTPNNYDS